MSQVADWSHEVVLAAEPASASKARSFVSQRLHEHGLPELLEDVQLVASELSTHVLGHAQTTFAVTLAASDDGIVLAVRDGSMETWDLNRAGSLVVTRLSSAWGVTADCLGSTSAWVSFTRSDLPVPLLHLLASAPVAWTTGRPARQRLGATAGQLAPRPTERTVSA
jgi:hypothetical protein